jgi:hypothetical protein
MILRNRPKDPKVMIGLGMLALALSIVMPWFITVRGGFGEDFVDGVRGVFLGMALGLIIWGARLGGFNRAPRAK